MKEKLIIKNFGPIKHVELELGRFNVLIGEQATGKSTVAKLLAVCRYFSYIIGSELKSPVIEEPFEEGLYDWGIQGFINDDTRIFYDCNHYSFTAERDILEIQRHDSEGKEYMEPYPIFNTSLVAKSDAFKNLIGEFNKIKPSHFDLLNDRPIPTSFYANEVSRVMDNPFYFPAERGLQSLFSLGNNPRISNSLFRQLADINEITHYFKQDVTIEPLDLIYNFEDGEAYVKKNTEDNFFALLNSAKGYQTTIPIVLVTKYYSDVRRKPKTFLVEEPESNLYPTAQQKLMLYLVDRTMNYNNSILLTTHSPYVLASLNNLIYSYKVGNNYPEETNQVIPKKYWLSQNEVSVYKMLPDGTCEDIFDRQEGLIKADKIDGISDIINKQFDQLLNIEFEKK